MWFVLLALAFGSKCLVRAPARASLVEAAAAGQGRPPRTAEWKRFEQVFAAEAGPRGLYARPRHLFKARHAARREPLAPSARPCNVLFLYPSTAADPNGAFDLREELRDRLLGWAAVGCSVHLWRVSDVLDATRVVQRYAPGSLVALVLGGHGAEEQTVLRWGELPRCGQGYLCDPAGGGYAQDGAEYNDEVSPLFFGFVKLALSPHATVVMDSCFGGRTFVDAVAAAVGRGVQVVGPTTSFSGVVVRRFGARDTHNAGPFAAAMRAQDPVLGARRVPVHEAIGPGAACPAWAERREPDAEGDCACPAHKTCYQLDGEDPGCPAAQGSSFRKFLPACASFGGCFCHPDEPEPAEPVPRVRTQRARQRTSLLEE